MTHAELAVAGYDVDHRIHERLARFVELLLEENKRINLTAIRTADAVWRVHICDSLALLPLADRLKPRKLLDLGTGGGIPGIPLACACDELSVTLLDATRKKLEAAARIATALDLGQRVTTAWGRAEDLAHDRAYREQFDAVTARAVAALPTLIEYASGFVRVGGECWFAKSSAKVDAEADAARRAAGQCGMKLERIHSIKLPDPEGERAVAVYTKLRPLRPDLPRGGGRPLKKPL